MMENPCEVAVKIGRTWGSGKGFSGRGAPGMGREEGQAARFPERPRPPESPERRRAELTGCVP